MFGSIISLFTGGINAYTTYKKQKVKMKELEMKSKARILEASTNAKVALMESGLAGDIAWENTAQLQSGWKDEWFTLLLSIPLVGCFVPGLTGYIADGFEAITLMPDWYMNFCGLAIGSAFGVKGFTKFMNLKSGVSLSNLDKITSMVDKIK